MTAAPDVAAFGKNAGPQALRIDYLSAGSRLAFYTPDFFVRRRDGNCFLVETKGREDRDVSAKARAAMAWCKAASSKKITWTYVYVPQGTFERLSSNKFENLVSLCQPALSELISEDVTPQLGFLFTKAEEAADLKLQEFIRPEVFSSLPPRYQANVNQAVMLFRFTENKENLSFAPVFTPLIGSLESACNTLLQERLAPFVPNNRPAQQIFFNPDLGDLDSKKAKYYQGEIKKLERTLVLSSPISPLGHLKFAVEIGLRADRKGAIFEAVNKAFGTADFGNLLDLLAPVYEFRNKFIAHQEKEDMVGKDIARSQLKSWIEALVMLQSLRKVT